MIRISRTTIIVSAVVLFVYVCLLSILPPSSLAPATVAHVESGMGTYATARSLKEAGVIRSSFVFHVFVKVFGGERSLKAGDYLIDTPTNVISLARRMVNGEYGFVARKVTFPEGTSVHEMADILSRELIGFNKEAFVAEASSEEGYLFPDTYLFMPTATSGEVIAKMSSTFEERIKEINQSIAAFNKPLKDIITMASILEEEGNDEKSRRIISGILWKRIALGMPLQVDAPFVYLIDKGSAELTKADLKLDSPYNTYKYKGLPQGPITNPGLDAILATVTPERSPYLYFLTDNDGVMHYSKTYEEHLALQKKYLK
ncbi:MAG: hypothetical protein RLY57_78 [Candidatus Parcubacteria bacterium]|jgi:UPF0755 protein